MDLALGLAVVAATLLGPILAVLVTRLVDEHRDERRRRLEVFRALMAWRRAVLSAERIRALNMVEIEFYAIGPVGDAYRELLRHMNTPATSDPGWSVRHQSLYTKLLSAMGKALGYNLPQLDVLEGGYYPQGQADIELEQQEVRRRLIALLSGQRPLSVAPAAPVPLSPFQPPPPPSPRSTPVTMP